MSFRIRLVSIVAIAISVFAITGAQAAVSGATATSKAIVETVLAQLGVQADESVIELVSDSVPESALNPSLVAQVSEAISNGIDPAETIIANTDSNNDGLPDASGADLSSNKTTNGVQSGSNVIGSDDEDTSENTSDDSGNDSEDTGDETDDNDYDHSQDEDDD
jgi:hypothetical protein